MTELPPWWIYASGIFFVLAIILVVGLGIAVLVMMQKLKAIQGKVEQTVDRAEKVVERLEGVAKTAQTTVDSIGGSAKGIAHRVEGFVESTAERAAPITSFLMIAMTGLKLYHQFTEMRKSQHQSQDEDQEGD